MPISKKRRSKALKTPTKAGAALPDRRAMEGFLAAIAGHRGDDATAKAQDVMYEAWERTTSRSRIVLAHKALGISPLCADAYVPSGRRSPIYRGGSRLLRKGRRGGGVGARAGRLQAGMQATSGAFSKHAPICGPGPASRVRS
jgi:hypothetical protein